MSEATPPLPSRRVQHREALKGKAPQRLISIVQRIGVGGGGLLIGYAAANNFASLTAFLDVHGGAIGAVAALAVAWFTYTLWKSTDRIQVVTAATLAHLEREFIAAHRPRLRIRQIEMRWTDGNISFVVANCGDSDATITEIATADWIGETNLPRPAVHYGRPKVTKPMSQQLPSGMSVREEHALVNVNSRIRAERERWPAGTDRPRIMFLCVVRYEDQLGVQRKTSAFAELTEIEPEIRFVRVPAEFDHNYED